MFRRDIVRRHEASCPEHVGSMLRCAGNGKDTMEQLRERFDRAGNRSGVSVAAAYLGLLADRGVDYLFGNAGTDFAPLIEAYAQAGQTGMAVPRPMLATHENLAVSMAH